MKVTGFSFIRNAVKYDYPITEAIKSILPLCDDFMLAVGNSDDQTLQLIESIKSDKIKIIHTVWDDNLRVDGKILAIQTNIAFDHVPADSDWAFYIQGDEVLHEKYLENVRESMIRWKDDKNVDGLLFNYQHFYGAYKYVADSRKWYRKEIRVIRNDKSIRSYKDAQGFRKTDNSKLRVKQTDASIYHYGWVKEPAMQQAKAETFNKYWHGDEWIKSNIPKVQLYDYSNIDSLDLFKGTHPEVMEPRVNRQNWTFEFDIRKKQMKFKYRVLTWIEKLTGWRIGEYKNYKRI
jgi:hypothetical protein